MWGLTTVVAAPIAAAMDFNRRRKTVQSVHAHRRDDERGVDFTERDRRTLFSE
jgi:hypothetical protein